MAQQVKTTLVLVPFGELERIRVIEDGMNQGEYQMSGNGKGGAPIGYDISMLLAEPKPEEKPTINHYLMSRENGHGMGWMQVLRGVAGNVFVLNAVARKLLNCEDWLLLMKHGESKTWYVVGNQLDGDLQVRTGGYTDENGKWHQTDMEAFEIECPYVIYPVCVYLGQVDVLPIEDLMTRK